MHLTFFLLEIWLPQDQFWGLTMELPDAHKCTFTCFTVTTLTPVLFLHLLNRNFQMQKTSEHLDHEPL